MIDKFTASLIVTVLLLVPAALLFRMIMKALFPDDFKEPTVDAGKNTGCKKPAARPQSINLSGSGSASNVRSSSGVSVKMTGKSVRIEIEPGGHFSGSLNGVDIEVTSK